MLSTQPNPALPDSYPTRSSFNGWVVILGFTLLMGLLMLGGAGSIVRLLFPAVATVAAFYLYLRFPILYLGFTWWIWFLTPWVRRYVDYRLGVYDDQPLILLTPFLVTFICAFTFLRYFPRVYRSDGLPFVLVIMAVTYSFLVGMVLNAPITAVRAFLDWMTPVLFGFHLYANWRDYPDYRQNTYRVFLWGVLLMGSYGIYQYMIAPEWDNFWIIGTELITFGRPEPLEIRVFSTMNSPGPFATTIMAGLLLIFNDKGGLRFPAVGVGYLSFMLSLVRTAWLGWIVAFPALILSLRQKFQIRLFATILLVLLIVVPLTVTEPFASVISERVDTLVNIRRDQSLQDRTAIYERNLEIAFSNALGMGSGGIYYITPEGKPEKVVFDSAVLDMFFTLGWVGAIPYLGGMLLLIYTLLQSTGSPDPFVSSAIAIVIGVVAQFGFGSAMLGASGLILWSFIGLGMAARRYYWQLRNEQE
ncbi:MAG: O-antigen ligase domain-containing protein [Leptolyngbyaceae cyanobacterium SL_7_1]|nr:O-antigen ligase domain-containing protein [Leptolyngbyaceae cyanobacterium SL_7_1]